MGRTDSAPEAIRAKWTTPLCHEDLFIERYQWLRRWALRLTGNITDADDLLHDAFLQFVIRRRDLSQIESIDGYLYGMLRRLRISKRRAALRAREDPLAAIDYDTAALSLRTADPRDLLRLRDELRLVCTYACHRKETSKSGSVLLLRFFHGFFPGEIARILKSPLRGANDWLRIARREAREYAAQPARAHGRAAGSPSNGGNDDLTDPLDEVRNMIWAATCGECPGVHSLAQIYGASANGATPSCRLLAHVVSCRECLARTTSLLGMQGPIDRDPRGTLRQDTSWRFARGLSSHDKGGPLASQLREWEEGLRAVREHVPGELRVAANGLPIGACIVNARECAFTVAVNIDEPLDFVEVFSEQGVRLVLWELDPPPAGDVDQGIRVALACDRSISLTARFNGHWPSLEITYRDPEWTAESNVVPAGTGRVIAFDARDTEPRGESLWQRLRSSLVPALSRRVLRPALAVLVLAAALGLWARAPWRSEPVSAAQILADARNVEIKTASVANVVVHRVLQLEERRISDGVVLMRRRIEKWHSDNRHVTARRVYDERGRLVAAELLRSDGTRTTYASGLAPRVTRTAQLPAVGRDTIWQWEPSAIGYERLIDAPSAVVREERGRYVLTYRARLDPGRDGLMAATLIVAKDPLRPIAQTLVVREKGETRAFDFAETNWSEIPEADVPGSRFEADAELLPAAAVAAMPVVARRTVRSPVDPRALERFEVDLLFTLHRLETCLEAPADIGLSSNGAVAVSARAMSPACRGRIGQAIERHRGGDLRAVLTFTSPMADTPAAMSSAAEEVDMLPAYRTLVARFAAAGLQRTPGRATADQQAVIAARAFGAWALEHSRRALEEARHLDLIATRWSIDALTSLDADRMARWQDVVRDHARRVGRQSEALRLQLGSLLDRRPEPPAGEPDETIRVVGPQDVPAAVARLVGLAGAQDAAVRQLFDPLLPTPRVPVDVAALIATMRRAEAQAAWFDEPWTSSD